MTNARANPLISLLAWLLPASARKTSILNRLGNRIDSSARIGPTLVMSCGPFTIGPDSNIGTGNVFRRLSAVEMSVGTAIGNFNQIVAAPEYQTFSPRVGRLVMQEHSTVTNRHYLDASGLILLRRRAGLGGVRCIFQSHEIDLADDVTKVGRIEMAENSMVATRCTLLMDSYLPERSVLAAGSLLTKSRDPSALPVASLYAGTPAKPVRELTGVRWWGRTSNITPPQPFDDSRFQVD